MRCSGRLIECQEHELVTVGELVNGDRRVA
jgi:hypothetical protein